MVSMTNVFHFRLSVTTSFNKAFLISYLFFRDVHDNPLHCDCKLRDFVKFVKSRTLTSVLERTSCQSPSDLTGTILKDTNLQNLDCDEGKILNPLCLSEYNISSQDQKVEHTLD
jgi:hypothetical protein